MVPIPEGQAIVKCPYCDMRSLVRGEHGIRRYHVPCQVDRQTAAGALGRFLSSHWAIALNAKAQAQLTETFLAYIPFWTTWARVLGWVFGQEKVGSGKNERWEPREKKIAEDMTWNSAACDVGEFGVTRVPLTTQPVLPFDESALHARGLVFEPVNSVTEARASAEQDFQNRVRHKSGVDRISQAFTRFVNERFGVVYYPLWVLRYLYRGRAFQVVVDGYSGEVLYGKAPGNTLYRAAVLVLGMAAGAFLAIDAPAILLYLSGDSSSDDGPGGLILIVFLIGLAIMWAAYRAFRYGEVHEFQRHKPEKSSSGGALFDALPVPAEVKQWLK
jgi:hypothetical protein